MYANLQNSSYNFEIWQVYNFKIKDAYVKNYTHV